MSEAAFSGAYPSATLSGRELARQRRAALSAQGRSAQVKTASMTRRPVPTVSAPAAASATPACDCGGGCGACGGAAAVAPAMAAEPALASVTLVEAAPTGRQLARARREALARSGKAGLQRVAQAVRLASTMPESDWRSALAKGATGRQLAMQRRLVQAVVGRVPTEASAPSGRPSGRTRPARAEVTAQDVTQTLQGQKVTGLPTQRSGKVTGNEPGTCRHVTGDQYLSADDFDQFCQQRPAAEPPKVASSSTLGGNLVSGPSMRVEGRVTGNEIGLCRGITGTQYLSLEQGQICATQTPSHPHKVSVMSSRGQQPVTGTAVGQSQQRVTGGEAGASRSLTGTQYAMARQPASWRQQTLTGDTPGVGGGVITGDERGACEPVTGTAYTGPDNLHAGCTVSSRWLTRFPEMVAEPPVAAPLGFSIQTPARQAQGRRSMGITGLPSQAENRVTGPGNKAGGLITGTPEFRHERAQPAVPMLAAAPRAPAPAALVAEAVQAPRLTGEGSQSGARVTGDAWGAMARVTGTEGSSASVRNPSLRGEPRGTGTHARAHRDLPRPEIQPSRVTGSSGNTTRGATVTVSGGARG